MCEWFTGSGRGLVAAQYGEDDGGDGRAAEGEAQDEADPVEAAAGAAGERGRGAGAAALAALAAAAAPADSDAARPPGTTQHIVLQGRLRWHTASKTHINVHVFHTFYYEYCQLTLNDSA